MATQSRTLKLSILAETKKLSDALKGSGKDVTTFGSQISAFGKKAALAFAAAGVAFGAFAKIAVSSASDLAETISKVGVLFGSSAKEIEIFAGTAAKSLGQTKQQALDAAATFAIFGTSAGLSGQELSKFSIDFVNLRLIFPHLTTHHRRMQSTQLGQHCAGKPNHCGVMVFYSMTHHSNKPP
jgi:hypothetical protein